MRRHDWSGFVALGAGVLAVFELVRGDRVVGLACLLLAAGAAAVTRYWSVRYPGPMRRATEAGITNIVPKLGDAATLPYADGTFDAVYLVGVLGEVPDGRGALREVRRVLKSTGRLVIGEVAFDPDFGRSARSGREPRRRPSRSSAESAGRSRTSLGSRRRSHVPCGGPAPKNAFWGAGST